MSVVLGATSLALGTEPGDSGSAAAAQKTTSTNWFTSWFGPTDKPAQKTPPKTEKDVKPDLTTAPSSPRRDEATGERAREQAALLRRLAVCDQLRLIATQKKDDNLMRQAEQLDERTWQIYTQRIAHLPASKAVSDDRVPEPRAEAGASEPPGGGRALSIRK
jgi:hypothetical protein